MRGKPPFVGGVGEEPPKGCFPKRGTAGERFNLNEKGGGANFTQAWHVDVGGVGTSLGSQPRGH